jgi:hypothetical protein
MILKIFSLKKLGEKIVVLFAETTATFHKKFVHNIGF